MEHTSGVTTGNGAQARTTGRRPPMAQGTGGQQSIAVIVTSSGQIELLRSCLSILTPYCGQSVAELIVVRAGAADELLEVMRLHPTATYLVASPGTSTHELRRAGLLNSRGDIVAFVDVGRPERQAWAAVLCGAWRDWVTNGGRLDAAGCDAVASAPPPEVSVVVPVHDGGTVLPQVLDAMMLTDLPRERWELVVVDDASQDDAALVAAQYADRLVRLPGRKHGPGYARNRGFEVTLGDCVTFVNADVMVQPDTLRRAVEVLRENASVDAVFGTYDTRPSAQGFVSQYRNLLQHYTHRRHTGYASTFSSACGTVRSAVFKEVGGYDEWHFARHQLEDLELGQRLRQRGHHIMLHPDIHSTHLKRWTLFGMIESEIIDRGVPWMRLVNRLIAPARPAARSMRAIKKRNTTLSWLAVGTAVLAWRERFAPLLLVALLSVVAMVVNNRAQLAFFRRERGLVFAVATIPLDVLNCFVSGLGIIAGWLTRHMLGEPRPAAAAEAFSEMAVKRWPPAPVKRTLETNSRDEHVADQDARNPGTDEPLARRALEQNGMRASGQGDITRQ